MAQTHKINSQQKTLYILGWFLLAGCVFFYFLLVHVPFIRRIPCWFLLMTGLYCPGCGATRAFVLLCQGKFLASLSYSPVILYSTVLYLWFMLSNSIEFLSKGRVPIGMQYRNRYLYIGIVLILGNWIVKNIQLIV